MFAFLPPAKVARTQRSPLSCVEVAADTTTQLTAPVVRAVSRYSAMGNDRVRPTNIAEAEIYLGGVTIRPSVFLTGIGEHSCWIVDENTRLLRVWNMHKPFWHRTTPRMAQIPTFTEEEGLPLFVAELGATEESLAFCTDFGAVSSLDHSVEFRFYSEEDAITVSAFSCQRTEKGIITAVGTTTGLVLIAIKTEGERIVVDFDRNLSKVIVRTSSSSSSSSSLGKWWRSWLPGRASTKENSNNNNNSINYRANSNSKYINNNNKSGIIDDISSCYEFTLLRFRKTQTTQLWAANAASEFFLLDFTPLRRRHANETGIRAKWATNISSILQRQCRIVAFDESTSQICCLVYILPFDGYDACLEIVTMDSNTGNIQQTLSMQSIGSLAQNIVESPLHHTKIYFDETQQIVTILSGHYCVRLNNRVGVRSPCSSEDVHLLPGVERPLGSSLLPDGRIVTIDITGPVESVSNADEALANTVDISNNNNNIRKQNQNQQEYILSKEAWQKSLFTGKREGMADMVRYANSILQTLRIDAKMSLDSAVLEASETIFSYQSPHEGNWARADLNLEDENMMMHVTNNLVRRQQEHRRFILTILLHKDIEPFLQPQTIAKLISMQESLLAMVVIRRLQNDSSYPLSTNKDVEFDVLTPLYRNTSLGINNNCTTSTVEDYFRLARNTNERELCQNILRDIIIQVANIIRNNSSNELNSIYTRATAAEIAFGEPTRVSMLLEALGEHLIEIRRSVLVDHRTKFDEAMAVATIFLLVIRAVDESREDLNKFYNIPCEIRKMLWTSSEINQYGIQLQVASVCTSLSNALAEVVVNANSTTTTTTTTSNSSTDIKIPSSSWIIPLADQLRLLDLIALIIHFSFRNHSQGGSSFFANAMRCTLFREPFLREPLGYPFGAPIPSVNPTIGNTILYLCEEFALEFTISEILVAICLAKPVEDPLEEKGLYNKLGIFCQRNPEMFNIALHALLEQHREWEVQLFPELLPENISENARMSRDIFLMQAAPQLAWLVNPTLFQTLAEEGIRTNSYLSYGDDIVTHRTRCLSMAKLAWVACGAPVTSSYYAIRLDEAIMEAQIAYLLPESKNKVLGPAEVVQSLLELTSTDAWAAAAKVAALMEETLREDLLTQIVRRAKLHDGEILLKIFHDGASELEVSRALETTAIGKIIIMCAELQSTSMLVRVWANVLEQKEQRLLASWMQARAAGLVC